MVYPFITYKYFLFTYSKLNFEAYIIYFFINFLFNKTMLYIKFLLEYSEIIHFIIYLLIYYKTPYLQ